MCGMCCRAIVLPDVVDQMINHVAGVENCRAETQRLHEKCDSCFIFHNWQQISKEEALAINPHLEVWTDRLKGRTFWTCTKFDAENNRCMIHDQRPGVCSNYPWYGRKPNREEPLYNPECGYAIDKQVV